MTDEAPPDAPRTPRAPRTRAHPVLIGAASGVVVVLLGAGVVAATGWLSPPPPVAATTPAVASPSPTLPSFTPEVTGSASPTLSLSQPEVEAAVASDLRGFTLAMESYYVRTGRYPRPDDLAEFIVTESVTVGDGSYVSAWLTAEGNEFCLLAGNPGTERVLVYDSVIGTTEPFAAPACPPTAFPQESVTVGTAPPRPSVPASGSASGSGTAGSSASGSASTSASGSGSPTASPTATTDPATAARAAVRTAVTMVATEMEAYRVRKRVYPDDVARIADRLRALPIGTTVAVRVTAPGPGEAFCALAVNGKKRAVWQSDSASGITERTQCPEDAYPIDAGVLRAAGAEPSADATARESPTTGE